MAVCEFGILTGLILHRENGTAEILVIREFGGESKGYKAGFYGINMLHYISIS
jgi:hypothetical protein